MRGQTDNVVHFGWIKFHYLLSYALIGAYLPYMPLYLDELGFEDWQIGWVFGAYGPAILVMPTLMTHLADRHCSNRLLICLGYFLAVCSLGLLCISSRFAVVILLVVLFSIAYSPLVRLMDGLTFEMMQNQSDARIAPPPYHLVRIWGSIGFMLPALVLFLVLSYTDLTSRAALVTAAVCGIAGMSTCFALPSNKRKHKEAGQELPGVQAWRALLQKPVLAMVGSLFFLFMAINVLAAFYSLLLSELGIDDEWVGLITNIGVVMEIPWILFMGRILATLGLKRIMVIGSLCMMLRLCLLAVIPNLFVAIATQVLHGPIVLCLFLIPPMYLNHKAEPSYRNSIQGLYGALCLGAARLLGPVTAGHVAEFGLQWAFALGTLYCAIATAWLIFGFRDDEADTFLSSQKPGVSFRPNRQIQ